MFVRLYFRLKPFMPKRLRRTARRTQVRHIQRRSTDVWPILEAAGNEVPQGWSGWPTGKSFAVVLTHDVESQHGLDRVRQLAELEMKEGFRSSFNFIPEGGYEVPESLRVWLVDNGFEVGVHDLHHDGHLYRSRKTFRTHADRINRYLSKWGACGFRSGFMLRELDWLHDLAIDYDASTFDTDPFEPQPEGAHTIFPFWIQHPDEGSEKGYVELPYTLPQDSTLFLALRERDPEIWCRKFDWVAERGGMALLNTHPDYIDFEGKESSSDAYPASHYRIS